MDHLHRTGEFVFVCFDFNAKRNERFCLFKDFTKPIMCAYKTVRVRFEVWGFQTRVEDFTQRVPIEKTREKEY